MEDYLGWKITLDGRHLWIEDYLEWKTTLIGREPWMEEDFGGRGI